LVDGFTSQWAWKIAISWGPTMQNIGVYLEQLFISRSNRLHKHRSTNTEHSASTVTIKVRPNTQEMKLTYALSIFSHVRVRDIMGWWKLNGDEGQRQ
jgi:hypothetical protein